MISEFLKRTIRMVEAQLSPLTETIRFSGHDLHLLRTIWWNEARQDWFDLEIAPYFQALQPGRAFRRIVDAGGSSGSFTVAAGAHFRNAVIEVFEPAPRNRIVIRRNAAKNGLEDRVRVHPFGLWNKAARLAFRTHGAISSLKETTMLDQSLPFEETVEVVTLDAWALREKLDALDLIKMDIEGAEIEALEGAVETLKRFQPEILLQAYHIRDGTRTLERCVSGLNALGYACEEVPGVNGFVYCRVPGAT